MISFNDLDVRHRSGGGVGLFDHDIPWAPFIRFWPNFAGSRTCSYTEVVGRLRREVMSTDGFYSDRQWHSTAMYAECIGPAGLDQELVVPLPSPPGIARRLVFFRSPGHHFTDTERVIAMLLQPHIADAVRAHARYDAQRRLTARQLDLVRHLASGQDIVTIARDLVLSPATVRKHLENAYARLGVTSRTAAVAHVFPDITWS
jgi:DNA-binding CsgD family transcriptional regulator